VISEQRERWLADGSPSVPTLVVDGVAHVLQHPSQAGMLLGLETPPALRDAWQVAWDIDSIMQALLELVTTTPWEALLEPMPVLGRTPLALAVDASVGIRALLEPFATGWFHWPGNPVTGETETRRSSRTKRPSSRRSATGPRSSRSSGRSPRGGACSWSRTRRRFARSPRDRCGHRGAS
jgi:hypothetical protein